MIIINAKKIIVASLCCGVVASSLSLLKPFQVQAQETSSETVESADSSDLPSQSATEVTSTESVSSATSDTTTSQADSTINSSTTTSEANKPTSSSTSSKPASDSTSKQQITPPAKSSSSSKPSSKQTSTVTKAEQPLPAQSKANTVVEKTAPTTKTTTNVPTTKSYTGPTTKLTFGSKIDANTFRQGSASFKKLPAKKESKINPQPVNLSSQTVAGNPSGKTFKTKPDKPLTMNSIYSNGFSINPIHQLNDFFTRNAAIYFITVFIIIALWTTYMEHQDTKRYRKENHE